MVASLSRHAAVGVALLATFLTAGVGSQDNGWSRFRGPIGSGVADSNGLPVQLIVRSRFR